MTNVLTLLVMLLALSLGIVIGEAFAPLSGTTTQALVRKTFEIQERLEELQKRYTSLEYEIDHLCRTDAGR